MIKQIRDEWSKNPELIRRLFNFITSAGNWRGTVFEGKNSKYVVLDTQFVFKSMASMNHIDKNLETIQFEMMMEGYFQEFPLMMIVITNGSNVHK